MLSISRFFIDRPIFKWCVVAIMACLFFFSALGIKRFAYPQVDLNEMYIESIVTGFSALEMEQEVTDKIEQELENVAGIESYHSKTYQNFSRVIVKIDPSFKVREVRDEVRNLVYSISDYPPQMESKPAIKDIKVDNKPMSILGVISFTGDLSRAREHALKIKRYLGALEGIAKIRDNIQPREVHILLDRDRLEQFSIGVEEVMSQINNNQRKLSAGEIKQAFKVKRLITYAKAKDLEDIENIILRATGIEKNGTIIRMKDVAEVKWSLKKPSGMIKFNGTKGYQLELVRKSKADIIATAESVNRVLDQYVREASDLDLGLVFHEDDSLETQERLSITYQNGIFGLILVCLTLFLFLNRSIALWSCWSIPSTLFLSLTMMWITGISINTVSLCAVIIMMGVVVDNPTIIGESTYYYQQMNFSGKESSLHTLGRVLKPLIFAGITTMVSFASMFFIPGTLGDFAADIPTVVVFMLLASFFESIFILPAHLAHTKIVAHIPWGEKWVVRLRDRYSSSLVWTLRRGGLMLVLMFSLLVVGAGLSFYFSKGFQLFPIEQAFKINFNATVDPETSLEFSEIQAEKIEKIIKNHPERGIIKSYLTRISDGEFEIQLRLVSYFERGTSAEEFKNYVLESVAKNDSITLDSLDYYIDGGGVPSGRPVEINVFAPRLADRKAVIEKITREMRAMGYFSQIISSIRDERLEYRVIPSEKTYYSGISFKQIAEILRIAYEGVRVGDFEFGGSSINWLLKFDDQTDFNHPLQKITALNPRGERISIEDLVQIEQGKTLSEIEREGGERKNVLSANFDRKQISSTEVYQMLSSQYEGEIAGYPEVRVKIGGEAKESFDIFQDFIFAIIISIITIYLLLVLQFNSLAQPFMVIMSIPFGVMGIMMAFVLHGYGLSFLAMVGILGFGGVVINASLIMVDYINELKQGLEREEIDTSDGRIQDRLREVIVRGASLRFRPILITTFTTTIGLIPTAYGLLGKTDAIIAPMAFSMLWGLLVGTVIGLYLVPLLYYLWAKFGDKSYTKRR